MNHRWLGFAFAGALTASTTASAAGIDDCERKIRRAPDEGDGYRCIYDHARTASAYDDAIQALTRWTKKDQSGWAWLSLANAQSDQDLPEAPASYEQAVVMFEARSEPRGLVFTHLGLSTWYGYKADAAKVGTALQRAEAAAVESQDSTLLASVRIQRARHLLARDGNMDEVVALARSVEAEAFPDGPYQLRLMVLHVLSSAFAELERVQDEVAVIKRMVELTQSKSDSYVEATARLKLLEVGIRRPDLVANGLVPDPKQAAPPLLKLAIRSGNKAVTTSVVCKVSTWKRAVKGLRDCLRRAEEIDDVVSKKEARERLALLLADQQPDEALTHADALLKLVEEEAGIIQSLVRALVLAKREDDAEPAFRDFAARVEARLSDDMQAQTKAELLATSKYGMHAAAEHARVAGHELDALAWLDRAYGHATRQRLAADHPRLRVPLDSDAIRQLQEGLGPNDVVIVYAVPPPPPDEVYPELSPRAFALSHHAIVSVELPLDSGFRTQARLFRDRLAQGVLQTELRDRLEQQLLAPVRRALPMNLRSITVVPDGGLHGFPFAALIDESVGLSEVPSLAIVSHARASTTTGSAWVFADPKAPPGVDAPPLPAAAREAEAVVASLDAPTLARTGDAASETALRDALASPTRLLHVAAHSIVDPTNPGAAMLVLAADEHNDGLVRLSELEDLRLDGSIVVLASCETVSGRPIPGEGPTSLAHGLLAAGAKAVVTTQWPIDDEEAERLYGAFYRAAKDDLSVADAVMRAKQERRDAGASPREWAGLTVFGDSTASVQVRRSSGNDRGGWLVLGLAGLGLAGVLYRSRTSKTDDR